MDRHLKGKFSPKIETEAVSPEFNHNSSQISFESVQKSSLHVVENTFRFRSDQKTITGPR